MNRYPVALTSILILILGIISLISPVYATGLPGQPLYPTHNQDGGENVVGNGGQAGAYQNLGSGLSGSYNTLQLSVFGMNFSYGAPEIIEWNGSSANYYTFPDQTFGDTGQFTTWTSTTTYTFNPDYTYAIAMTAPDNYGEYYFYGNTVDGSFCENGWGGYCSYNSRMYYVFGYTPPTGVTWNFPVDSTTYPDFTDWVVNTVGLFDQGILSINYGLSSSTLDHHDSIDMSNPFYLPAEGLGEPLYIAKNSLLWTSPMPYPVTWYAQAVDTITATSGTTYYFTPVISFSIDPTSTSTGSITNPSLFGSNPFLSGAGSLTLPTSTIASCGGTDYLCQLEGWLITNLENILAFGLTPSEGSITAVGSLTGSIATKIPFGYLGLISTAFNGLNADTTPVVTTADLAPLSGMISPIDEIMGAIVDLILALWLVHRIRTLEL